MATNRVVTLLLKGDNSLTARGDNCAAVHAYETSSLVIDRAEDCTDAEARLVAFGGRYGAGIGCGMWEMMGDIEIKGGTIEATGGYRGAGIGAGQGGGAGGEGDDPKRAKIVISGGVVTAQGGDQAAGIGCGWSSWGPQIEIAGGRIKATEGINSYADIGSAPTASTAESAYTTIAISGGTIESGCLGWTGYNPQGKAKVTITGGSVLATAVAPSPTNGVATVHRVTVEGLSGEAAVSLGGLPTGYGTRDIFAVGGKVCLWLPDGRYMFSVDGVPYLAKVAGSDTTAKVLSVMAVIRMGEDGHAIVEPIESVEGCTYSVKASETLDFTDCVIVPVGRIEDLRYHFFRVIVEAVSE